MDKTESLNEQDKQAESNNNTEPTTPESQENTSDPKVAELEAKVNELNDKYLRLYSEFDNYRKRTVKERSELSKTAGEDIFKSILPVMDDFERAMRSIADAKDIKAVEQGVVLIYNKLKNTLTNKGLEPMESLGQPFDSEVHEAITNIPAPSEDLTGKVVDEVEKGYMLNGKIIRFAKVIVGS